MRIPALVLAAFLFSAALLAAVQQSPPPAPAVKVGQQAPDFTLRYLARTADDKYEQKTVSLGEFKGQKTVILAFFPAAFSPG
jgi:hypothetical protein